MSIVITGNPGVGKHTITKKLARILELPVIDINDIAKDAGLFEKNKDTNDVDTSKLKRIINEEISEKNLIVGHLAPYVLSKNKVKTVIILRRNPYDLISVYKERKYSDEKSKKNAASEILGIIAYDAISKFQEKAFQVNVNGKNIQEIIKQVLSIISLNEGNEDVDWLEVVTRNNDLKKFFVD